MSGGLVSAVDWHETEGKWTCNIVYYDNGYVEHPLTSGSKISFRVEDGRYCTGYYSNRYNGKDSWKSLQPCPYSLKITHGTRCLSCRRNDIMTPCIRCDGSTCLARYEVQKNA